jgi:hypothetical protein
MERVFVVRAVRTGNGRRSFSLQSDLKRLEDEIARLGDVKLVIIDPISSYLGKVDSHKNAEVRSVLEPLGEMASRMRVAVVCNNHFSKGGGGANSRIIGSVAFVNQSRAAFIVTPDAESEGRKLLMPSKMNLAPLKHGLAYRIEGYLLRADQTGGEDILTSRIAWESEPVKMTADQALAAHEGDAEDRSAAREAEQFLQDKLSAGSVAAKEAEEHARALGIAPRTLRRARKKLGVKTTKDGNGGWTWRPPEEGQAPGARRPTHTLGPLAPWPLGSSPQSDQGLSQAEIARGPRGQGGQSLAPGPLADPDTIGRRPNGCLGTPAIGPDGDSLDDFK